MGLELVVLPSDSFTQYLEQETKVKGVDQPGDFLRTLRIRSFVSQSSIKYENSFQSFHKTSNAWGSYLEQETRVKGVDQPGDFSELMIKSGIKSENSYSSSVHHQDNMPCRQMAAPGWTGQFIVYFHD